MKKRILVFSNPLVYSSGYSCQALILCRILLAMGHEIYYIDCGIPCANSQELFNIHQIRSMYEQQHPEFLKNIDERMDVLKRITFVRYMYDVFPRELFVKDFNTLIDRYNIDYTCFFLDVWIIKTDDGIRFNCPAICWLPIHFEPVEELTVKAAALFDPIVCLSHDGVKKLKKIFPDKKILRIPHVIDFDHFSTTPVDKGAVRKSMGIPEDCFLVTIVYNFSEATSRKTPEIALSAFKNFNCKYPNSRLYIHGKLEHGVDVNELIDHLEMRHLIIASDQAKMAKGGYTFDFVVNLMKVSDVLFNATASEGFGLSLIESQALGIPAIGADSTAMPDNLYNGELCQIYQKKFCLQNTSYWFLPSISSAAECIEKIYLRTPEEKKRLSRYGMKCIRENYNLKTLYDAWYPLFK